MLWLKAFHLIAVICWFAAIFYLPRLFVYHAMAEDQTSRDRFKIMERKLYRGIMNPSMIATLVLGIWMLALNWDYYKTQGWLHAKITLVVLLIAYFTICGRMLKRSASGGPLPSSRALRWFNEIPVLALLAIIYLVLAKPF